MNRIREMRLAMGWRQEDLGEKMHLKKNTISRYETGSLGIDAEDVARLCDLFGCTADYLIGRSDNPYPQISEEDAKHLETYHALPPEIRRAVDGLMAPYAAQAEKEENAG